MEDCPNFKCKCKIKKWSNVTCHIIDEPRVSAWYSELRCRWSYWHKTLLAFTINLLHSYDDLIGTSMHNVLSRGSWVRFVIVLLLKPLTRFLQVGGHVRNVRFHYNTHLHPSLDWIRNLDLLDQTFIFYRSAFPLDVSTLEMQPYLVSVLKCILKWNELWGGVMCTWFVWKKRSWSNTENNVNRFFYVLQSTLAFYWIQTFHCKSSGN